MEEEAQYIEVKLGGRHILALNHFEQDFIIYI